MEAIHIILDDHDEYNRHVHMGVAQASDITIVSKSGALQSGAPGVCISFKAMVDDEIVHVQAVTTLRNLMGATEAFAALHFPGKSPI